MNCSFCGSAQTKVTNSRLTKKGLQIWRRRKCLDCGETVTTYERPNLSHLIIVKKSGKRQRYSRAKLYSGIYHSTIDKKGADRGDMGTLSEEITESVEKKLISLKRKVFTSEEIMQTILKILRTKAPDALLRFVAYKEGNNKKKMTSIIKKYF